MTAWQERARPELFDRIITKPFSTAELSRIVLDMV